MQFFSVHSHFFTSFSIPSSSLSFPFPVLHGLQSFKQEFRLEKEKWYTEPKTDSGGMITDDTHRTGGH
ncbi:hypothetical protein CR205_14050 [Alteribacter lacisalsi]|uniref:Uncharacterized protein n=1 Tax=Alteribacter lacisalsi TaxID=2045244 RepID=A0A2W0HJ15_9BACI|nr:hypothetical protein CR205_14050 [Alteribacter lacisalsi]